MNKHIYDFDKGVERRTTDSKKFDPSVCKDDILPFWIADTEFPSPIEVVDELRARLEMGHFGYPYINKEFERSVARWYKTRHNVKINPDYVGFSPCVIPAMIWFVEEFSSIGDKVLIQTPVYPPFHALVENNGRQLACNEMNLVNGQYEIDFDDLENKLSDSKLKVMFVCNPQNPTGRNYTKEELTKIGNLCLKYDVKVGVDEIHADIVFDENSFTSFCSINDEFAQNSVTFINPAKTFNVAGFRTAAWFTHNEKFYKRMINQQTYKKGMGRSVFGAIAFTTCYNKGDSYADQCVAYLKDTRDEVINYIKENIPQITAINPQATFLIWLDCRNLGFKTQKKLEEFMENKAKVLLNSGTTFGQEAGFGFMRFNFASQRNIVMEGLKRIEKAVKELS